MEDLIPLNDTATNGINSSNETQNEPASTNNSKHYDDHEYEEEIVQLSAPSESNTTSTPFAKQSMMRLFLILLSIIGLVTLVIVLLNNNSNSNDDKNVTVLRPIVNDSLTTTTEDGNTEDIRNRNSTIDGVKESETDNSTAVTNPNGTGENSTDPTNEISTNKSQESVTDNSTAVTNPNDTGENSTDPTEPINNEYNEISTNKNLLKYILKSHNGCILGNTMSMSSNGNYIVFGEMDTNSTTVSNDNIIGIIDVKLHDIPNNQTSTITTINATNNIDFSTIAISPNGNIISFVLYQDSNTYIRVLQYTTKWNQVGTDILYSTLTDQGFVLKINSSTSNGFGFIALGVGYFKDSSFSMRCGKSSVYLYDYIKDWTLIEETFGTEAGDALGTSISLAIEENDITFVASAPDASPKNGDSVGAFYIHRYDIIIMANNQTHIGFRSKNTVYGVFKNDSFGTSISLSEDGDRIAVGAKLYSKDDSLIDNGMCNVYEYESAKRYWSQVNNTVMGEFNHSILGSNVILSSDGNRFAVASKNIVSDSIYTTIVHLYEHSGNWTSVVDEFTFYYEEMDIGFGTNIGLNEDGSLLVISSDGSVGGGDCGQIFLYDVSVDGSTSE